MKILVIGSINMDLTTYVDRLPTQGETKFGRSFKQNPGGKGANQACACALAGGDVTMLGAVGNDSYGTVLEKTLKECNVVPKLKYDDSVSSGCASILIEEEKHDNRIIVVPGANFSVTVDLVKDNISLLEEADIVITQLEIPMETVEFIGKKCKELNKTFILNPAPGQKLSAELLSTVTYLTPNETELALISGLDTEDYDSMEKACSEMVKKGVKNLLVTLGSKGVYFFNEKNHKIIPAFKVSAVDTTAAGDCFNGTFASFIAKGYQVEAAIKFAQKASSICVQRRGAIPSLPKLEEILK